MPAAHERPFVHVVPHAPQFDALVIVLTQALLQ